MTPDELRIRCAEIDLLPLGIEIWTSALPSKQLRYDVPHYCDSIDAINAAVLRLNEDDQFEWTMELQKILMEKHKMAAGYLTKEIATASAIDRAKAFAAIHS